MLRLFYIFLKIFTIFSLIAISVAIYLVYYYSRDLPDYSQLADYHPPSVTRVYAQNGKLMEEYALERRVFVPINSVPRSLIEAFISAEDKNFFEHSGIDFVSIIRASILNIYNILHRRRVEGGSTITQQVVKNFLLTSEISIERKIKEAILSYMISRTFTKDQILELYLNQTFFGRGAYGVAMAAQNYFNKSIEDLTIAESAFIAGLPKAPSSFNPEKNYARVKERRDYVIMRMLDNGYITSELAKESIDTPIILKKRDSNQTVTASYYAEQVREEVISRLASKEYFYTGGLTIITSLDTDMQQAAENALRNGIRNYDRKSGFRGAVTNIDLTRPLRKLACAEEFIGDTERRTAAYSNVREDSSLGATHKLPAEVEFPKRSNNWQDNLNKVTKPSSMLEYQLAVVLNVFDNYVEIGLGDSSQSKITLSEMKWAKNNLKSAKTILKKGDVIIVEKVKEGYALRQIPEVNGAIMVMKPSTGQVLACVGGYDFAASQFDRATQALRQPGSLSKTFVYLAALENSIQPNKIFEDAPVVISQGPGMPVWQPKNYRGDFLGPVTMRTGLEKSRNLVTVNVLQAVGVNKVVEIIKRLGVNDAPRKFMSIVLGSLETTLERMTTAYGTIANSGQKVQPYFVELIKDRNGKIIYRRDNRECKNCQVSDAQLANHLSIPTLSQSNYQVIIDEASNYQIISLLTGAVERGTAMPDKKLGKIIAGKSGTTNDSKDTWFVGFTPKIVVGTYIGYDTPKTLGKTATGSTVALPIFIDFMEKAYADVPSLPFKVPESIKLLPVNSKTGKITSLGSEGSIMEAFKVYDLPRYQEERQDRGNVPMEIDHSEEVY